MTRESDSFLLRELEARSFAAEEGLGMAVGLEVVEGLDAMEGLDLGSFFTGTVAGKLSSSSRSKIRTSLLEST